MKTVFFSLLTLVSLLAFVPTNASAQSQTIVGVAAGNEDFSTLVAAVKAAGLAETLSSEGPFTVFAPTNAAFAALPDGLVEALLKPENKEALQAILTYHVVAGKLKAADVVAGIKKGRGTLAATTVQGTDFTVMQKAGKVQIKDGQGNVANVTATDVMGSNGVIHVIDKIILPAGLDASALLAPQQTIVEIAAGNENFSTLVAAVKAGDLAGTLSGEGPFTVFAPTNEAFAALPKGLVEALLKPENKQALQTILTYHVVAAKLPAADVVAGIKDGDGTLKATTVQGGTFKVMLNGDKVNIKDAQGNVTTVTATDIMGSNGVIHVIDKVILPAGVDPAALLR
ncbi:MAG: fasciclin domain-containing protein [Bacteroidota bacterium]